MDLLVNFVEKIVFVWNTKWYADLCTIVFKKKGYNVTYSIIKLSGSIQKEPDVWNKIY